MGFNEGALEIRISTRNGAGVAKGSPILVDYGPGFSMEVAARLVGGSNKNFRGALDATFASQRAALPEEADMNAEQAAREDAEAATAAEAERKRKAEADAREEEAAKRAKTEAAEKKKAEAAAKAATEAQAAGARGDQSPPGELVSVVSAPPCELRLAPEPCAPGVSAGARVLVACSTGPANKKLPKQLVLAKWSEHLTLSSRVKVGPAFELHSKCIVFSKEAQACLPIGQAFREQYQQYGQIFAYQAFPVGSLPKVLTKNEPDKEYRLDFSDAHFDSSRAIVGAAIEAARTAPGLQVVWMVKADAPKQWVKPYGVAIATTAQVHLAGAAEQYFVDGPPAA